MYQSPVPLIVIRSAAHSLIEVNGQILGECRPGSHVAMPAGDTGDYYISVTPLEGMGWPTTRKLTLDNGAALPPEGDSVELCAWPGGVYEVSFSSARNALRPADLPRQLDQLSFSCGRSRRTLTLYYEGGLRLLIEAPAFLPGEFHGQRSLVGYSPWGRKESDMTERLTLSRSFPNYLTILVLIQVLLL